MAGQPERARLGPKQLLFRIDHEARGVAPRTGHQVAEVLPPRIDFARFDGCRNTGERQPVLGAEKPVRDDERHDRPAELVRDVLVLRDPPGDAEPADAPAAETNQ